MSRIAIPTDMAPLAPVPAGVAMISLGGPTMGVDWTLKALSPPGLDPLLLQSRIQGLLDGVVGQMSPWEPGSDISRFNSASAGSWVKLPNALFVVLEAAIAAAEASGGAFDPTIGALVDLWGFGPPGPVAAPPSHTAIEAARALAGWRRLEIDPAGRSARQPGGLRLDFSGIAKGFAVDAVAHLVEGLGVRHYLLEIGGELKGLGNKPDGQPWWVELETAEEAAPPGGPLRIALHGLAVATSGDYRRFLLHQGRRYGHTLDPRTGWPCDEALAAVSVLHPSCMQADALCTLLTVLGPNEGPSHAARIGVPALFTFRGPNGPEEHPSPALEAMLA